MIYITGDTHRDFHRIETFCKEHQTSYKDLMIILGDAGINYYGDWRDESVKDYQDTLPITFFFIHGNHEQRPESIQTYSKKYFDKVQAYCYYEHRHPNLYFAVDGEIYLFEGQRFLVCGGAYSIDKDYRQKLGWGWWPDEQPSSETKARVAANLHQFDGDVDFVLTHTCPIRFEPTEAFLPSVDQSSVDKSTERWLDEMYDQIKFLKWFCGHYHIDKAVENVRFVYDDILALSESD